MTIMDISPTATRPQVSVPLVIYGNRWCGMTQMIRRALDRSGIGYEYVDLDLHPDIDRKLRRLTGPALRTPVVYVDGEWLTAPSLRQVASALRRHGGAW